MPLVDFIAQFMGENTEVALLDLTDWTSSVVAIHNGHITCDGNIFAGLKGSCI